MKLCYWPGNVRQLKNLIERVVLICPMNIISETYINNLLGNNSLISNCTVDDNVTLEKAVSDLEKQLIYKALRKYKNTRDAAKALGVSQPTIVRKSHKYNIKTL